MRKVPPGTKIIVDELLRSTGRLRNCHAAPQDALLQCTLSRARRRLDRARWQLPDSLSRKASAPIGPWSNAERKLARPASGWWSPADYDAPMTLLSAGSIGRTTWNSA